MMLRIVPSGTLNGPSANSLSEVTARSTKDSGESVWKVALSGSSLLDVACSAWPLSNWSNNSPSNASSVANSALNPEAWRPASPSFPSLNGVITSLRFASAMANATSPNAQMEATSHGLAQARLGPIHDASVNRLSLVQLSGSRNEAASQTRPPMAASAARFSNT